MAGRSVFRVAFWNIHHGAPGARWFANHASVTAGVAQLDADVIVLSEVDQRVWRSWFRDQAHLLGSRLGYHVLFAPARRLSPGWYGNALLSRTPPERTEVLALPARRGAETRSAVLTSIPIGGTSISVAGTHLQNAGSDGGGHAEAISQLGVVTDAMASRPSPAVLAGDFNLLATDVEPAFALAGLSAVPTGPTYPFPTPRRRIDWMGVRGLEVVSSGTVPIFGSDHVAISADLTPSAVLTASEGRG